MQTEFTLIDPVLSAIAAAACALLLLLGAVCVPVHAQTNWLQQSPAASPSARFVSAMANDGAGNVVLFGGEGNNGLLGDTWVYVTPPQVNASLPQAASASATSRSGALAARYRYRSRARGSRVRNVNLNRQRMLCLTPGFPASG
jgi:Galactose oxidase, central domain